ncbi:MAG: hypothetical protein ABW201_11830 [Candidatus Thiodiazotropha sp.]
MKEHTLIVVILLLLIGCGQENKYRVSQDPIERKLFEKALQENRIEYTIDKDGWYSTSTDKYDQMLSIGEKILKNSSQKIGLRLSSKCHKEELTKYFDTNSIIFNIEKTDKGSEIFMRKQDFEDNNIIGRSVCIENSCKKENLSSTIQRCHG